MLGTSEKTGAEGTVSPKLSPPATPTQAPPCGHPLRTVGYTLFILARIRNTAIWPLVRIEGAGVPENVVRKATSGDVLAEHRFNVAPVAGARRTGRYRATAHAAVAIRSNIGKVGGATTGSLKVSLNRFLVHQREHHELRHLAAQHSVVDAGRSGSGGDQALIGSNLNRQISSEVSNAEAIGELNADRVVVGIGGGELQIVVRNIRALLTGSVDVTETASGVQTKVPQAAVVRIGARTTAEGGSDHRRTGGIRDRGHKLTSDRVTEREECIIRISGATLVVQTRVAEGGASNATDDARRYTVAGAIHTGLDSDPRIGTSQRRIRGGDEQLFEPREDEVRIGLSLRCYVAGNFIFRRPRSSCWSIWTEKPEPERQQPAGLCW